MPASIESLRKPVLTAFAIVAMSACGGASEGTTVPLSIASVTVTPSLNTLLVGQATQLALSVRDGVGGTITGHTASWLSSNVGVATVSSSGMVRAVAEGTASISATVEGKTGESAVVVQRVPVAAISIGSVPGTVFIGQTVSLTAIVKDSVGSPLDGRTVAWSSSNSSVALVSSIGQVTGVALGTAVISAASEGKSGSATLTIVSVGPRLVVAVDGVPNGISNVPLQVKNSDLSVLFNTTVGVTTPLSLSTLPVGQYTLTAGQVVVSSGEVNFVYLPPNAQQVQTVTVGQFITTNVLLNYTLRTGAISITASGLPAGTLTACVLGFAPPGVQGIVGAGVQTPSGQTKTVQAYGTGPGTLTCSPVTIGSTVYQASPFQQSITIPASMTPATATVLYAPTP